MNETLRDIELRAKEIKDGYWGESDSEAFAKIRELANCVAGLAVAIQVLNERKQER
jgi:hypothetical protein